MVATSLVSQLPNDRAVVRGCNEDVVDVFRPGDLTQLAHCAGDMDAIRMRLVVQEAEVAQWRGLCEFSRPPG